MELRGTGEEGDGECEGVGEFSYLHFTHKIHQFCARRKLGVPPPNSPFNLSVRSDLFVSETDDELRRRLGWEADIYSAILDLQRRPPDLLHSRYLMGDIERELLSRKVEVTLSRPLSSSLLRLRRIW